MKQVILTALVLAMAACGTSRETVKSDARGTFDARQTQTVERAAVSEGVTASRSTIAEDETATLRVEEFDTARPVDPSTGTPPLARRVTREGRRTTAAISTGQTAQVQTVAETLATDTTAAATTTERLATTERRGLSRWQRIALWCLGAGAIAVVALFIRTWILLKRIYKPF